MRHLIVWTLLATCSSIAHADWYAGGALGLGFATAKDFRFHNPVGAPGATPPGVVYVPMNGVDDTDSSGQWSLRGGYARAGSPWRVELDLTQRSRLAFKGFGLFGAQNFQQDLRVRSTSALLMGYYDHALNRDWAVYGGLGLGWARNRSNGLQGANLGGTGYFPSASHSNLAWAAALGANYKVNERVTADLGYRFVSLGKADTGTTDASFGALAPFAMNPNERLEAKLRAHEIRLGLTYRF